MEGESADTHREHLISWSDERQKKLFNRAGLAGFMTLEETRCPVQEKPGGQAKAVRDTSDTGEVRAGKKTENIDQHLVREIVEDRHGQARNHGYQVGGLEKRDTTKR